MTIEILPSGIVSPLTDLTHAKSSREPGYFNGGTYYSDGTICETGVTVKGSYRNVSVGTVIPPLRCEPGCHLFGGMLQNTHFGHFLAESLSRLWAMEHLSPDFRSVVFYPRILGKQIPSYAVQLFSLIKPESTFKLVTEPTAFELLAVPKQIAHPTMGFVEGQPSVRKLLAPLRAIGKPAGRKVYVSRSRMKPYEGGILFEERLESFLQADGYDVVHPQELSIEAQIEIYNSASHLVFSEGSALHLYALVAKPSQKVFIVWRRKMTTIFDWQIRSFGGDRVSGRPAIKRLFVPDIGYGAMVRAKAEIAFDELHLQLLTAEMISTKTWNSPSDEEILEEVSRISSLSRSTYNSLPA